MVPKGWNNKTLGDILDFRNGLNTDISQYGKGYKFVNVMDVFGNDVITESKIIGRVQVTEKQLTENQLKFGDILFNRTSETFDEIAMAAVYLDNAIATFGGFVIRGRPKSEDLAATYSVYAFQANGFRGQAIRLGQGAVRANIGQKDLAKVSILIPPLPEQQKIARTLSTWDKAITNTEKRIDNSKQQKKALMQLLLTGKKRFLQNPDNFSIREGFAKRKLGLLPDDWNVTLISDYYWFQEGPGVRKHQFTEAGIKLFNGTNIQQSRINLSNTKTHISSEEATGPYSHFLADAGDLVIACSGISVDRFDEKIAFIEKKHLPICMNTSTMRFKVKDGAKACLNYLSYFMMSPLFKNQIRRQITGSAQLNFGPSHLAKCYIPLPTSEEQKKISDTLINADKEIDLLEQQLVDLKQEKKALMQQLLTGKRRVKIDEGEAA